MRFFYKVTAKELLDIRNKIVLETAIPTLFKKGFNKTPFSSSWFGRNNLKDFSYELCRLTSDLRLEIIEIQISRGDRWIKFYLNIFEINPQLNSLDLLKGTVGTQYKIPPNSITEMRLRSDDIKGPPLFRLRYMHGHKLKTFKTKAGLIRKTAKLDKTIEMDLSNIDNFVKRWHELHHPMKTSWTGQSIGKDENMDYK